MQISVILRSVGLLLTLFSFTMLPSVLVSLIYEENVEAPFLIAFATILVTGLVTWFPFRRYRHDLRLRDGFVVVVIFWTVLGMFGSLPLYLNASTSMSFTDSAFESMPGLTTTGATVISNLDSLPKAILFYRQQLQWLGGMGIIVLAVAVLPMLGIGGMQLYRAETPGPMKDSKLTPRITETAKALWYIYLGLTFFCALAYWIAGMTLFDAISHSFSTVAIGGFSTHDASMGFFNSYTIEMVAVCFMLIAGVNFSLHFVAWRSHSVRNYFFDPEFKAFIYVIIAVSVITVMHLYFTGTFSDFSKALHHGIFQTVSIATTAGFTTENYNLWPSFLLALLLMASFIGGCAGSTGGGMKVIRVLLLYRQGLREIMRLIHPNAVIPVKIGKKPLADYIVSAVWGFFSLYVVTYSLMSLLLAATGLDLVTAFSAVAACLNNLGPGLGGVALHYGDISDFAKWILCFAMLAGRLEIFTLLVFFSPAFWRR